MRVKAVFVVCCLALLLGSSEAKPAAATGTTTITIAGFVAGSVWVGAFLYDATFVAAGAIEDEGAAEGSIDFLPWGTDYHWTMTLTGGAGTLTVEIWTWDWVITRGTGAYGGVTGSGTCEAVQDPNTYMTIWTLTGTVSKKGKKQK